jgi:hypothetical protein
MFDVFSSSRASFTVLNETNYLEWKDNMMGLLMAKKLWQYIVTEHPVDDINDQQAKGYIWINIEHQQRSHIPAGASAHRTWHALCAKHEQVGPQVIANCIFGITALRYTDGTKMEDHLGKIKEYFTRLDAVNCQLPETVKAVFVLNSLPPSWSVFRQTQTAAATTAHPLTVSTVCLAILQERDRRLTEDQATTTSLINSANALVATHAVQSTSRQRDGKPRPRCAWCDRVGHTEDRCWAKETGKDRVDVKQSSSVAALARQSVLLF